jgi:hypothetical protein
LTVILGFSRENNTISESMANRRSAAAAIKTSVGAGGFAGLNATNAAAVAQNAARDHTALYIED